MMLKQRGWVIPSPDRGGPRMARPSLHGSIYGVSGEGM